MLRGGLCRGQSSRPCYLSNVTVVAPRLVGCTQRCGRRGEKSTSSGQPDRTGPRRHEALAAAVVGHRRRSRVPNETCQPVYF
jgi:hypothetical protein